VTVCSWPIAANAAGAVAPIARAADKPIASARAEVLNFISISLVRSASQVGSEGRYGRRRQTDAKIVNDIRRSGIYLQVRPRTAAFTRRNGVLNVQFALSHDRPGRLAGRRTTGRFNGDRQQCLR